MGKVNYPFARIFSYVLCGMGLAALGGCAGDTALMLQSGRMIGLVGLEGRWVGPVSPMGPGCGSVSTGLMSIGKTGFAFDPFQSTVVIRGDVADGQLKGSLERIGGERRVIRIGLDATARKAADGAESIEGELLSGSCRWRVQLQRG